MKKPKATVKDFPGVSLVLARKLVKTTNSIVDVLWPFPHKKRVEILSEAISKLGS